MPGCMRNTLNAALFLLLPALAGTVQAGDALTPRAVVDALHAAMRAGDRETVLQQFTADALIYEAGHVERSREEYARGHLGNDLAFSQAVSRKVTASQEQLAGDLAVVVQETESSGRWKDRDVHLIGTETTVLERRDGRWQIRHVHWSSRKAH